jgi:glycosyltransferase involved in cell wall biosynthesis
MLAQITPVILTLNEAPNLRRALEQLQWAEQVIVLDSFSNDETRAIAADFANVVVVERRFDTFGKQWNAGIDQAHTDWILSLDADYVFSDGLQDEISQLDDDVSISAYFTRFRYCIAGRPLRGSLYPPRAVLLRKSRCRFFDDGHAQGLNIDGATKFLRGYLLHDDRKSLGRWLDSQRNYARIEARKLMENSGPIPSLADRVRRHIWPAAPLAFFYALFLKGCLFDGWPGWYYALQRAYAELLLSLELLDRRLLPVEGTQTIHEGDVQTHDEYSRSERLSRGCVRGPCD